MNKILIAWFACGFLTGWSLPAYGTDWIPPKEAKYHVGQEREVCGQISQVTVKPYGSFINMTKLVKLDSGYYKKIPEFTVLYWRSDWENVGVNDPERYFGNKKFCFRGIISSYRTSRIVPFESIPQIRLTDYNQFRLYVPEETP